MLGTLDMSDEGLRGWSFSTKKRQGTLTHTVKQSGNLSFQPFSSISWNDAGMGNSQQHSGLGVHTNKQKTWNILTSQKMLWDDKCNSYKMLALIIFGKWQSIYSSPEWWFAGSLHGKDLRVAISLENIEAACVKAEFREPSHSWCGSLLAFWWA